jgi:hypothetical protein
VVWKARPAPAQWQALLVGGLVGFGCAIGVHYPMGYLSGSHLAPAWTGALIYLVGIVCFRPAMQKGQVGPTVLESSHSFFYSIDVPNDDGPTMEHCCGGAACSGRIAPQPSRPSHRCPPVILWIVCFRPEMQRQ